MFVLLKRQIQDEHILSYKEWYRMQKSWLELGGICMRKTLMVVFAMLFVWSNTVFAEPILKASPDHEILCLGSFILYEGDCDAPDAESRVITGGRLFGHRDLGIAALKEQVDSISHEALAYESGQSSTASPKAAGCVHNYVLEASLRVHKQPKTGNICTTWTDKLYQCSKCKQDLQVHGGESTHTYKSTTCKNWVPSL